jgi:autotransporter-associated beta strand protein
MFMEGSMITRGMKRVQVKASHLFCAAMAALFLSLPIRAADYTWDGSSSADWGTPDNWSASPGWGDTANMFFYASGAGNLSTFLGGASRTVGSLTFNANATATVRIRLANSATGTTARDLNLGSATVAPVITVDAGSSAIHYIGEAGGNVVLLNNLTVTQNSSANLHITRPVTGSYGITKEGTGGLRLLAANTYTGKTLVKKGSVVIASAAGLGSEPASFVADQLTLDGGWLTSSSTITSLGNRGITLGSGGGGLGPFNNITLTIDTPITGVGTLSKVGSGTVVLAGDNTYSGGTTVDSFILRVGHNNALSTGPVTFNSGATRLVVANGVTITNSITLNGGVGEMGRGLIENGGASGNATISNGTISITGNASAGGHFASTGTGGSLTIASPITSSVVIYFRAGTGIFSGGGSYNDFTISAGTVRLGADNGLSTSATLAIAASATAYVDLSGFSQQLAGITKGGYTAVIGNNSGDGVSTLTTTGTSVYAGIIQDTLGTAGGKVALTVDGGALTLFSANSYTGPTTISAGTLQLGNAGLNGSLSPASALSVAENALFTVNQTDTLTQGTEFSSAAITGAGGFTQAGTGTTILTAANSYTGPTTVSAGTLQLGNAGTDGSLSTASAISVALDARFAVNQTDTVTQGTEFSGAALTGAGGFTQAGTGTTLLTAANSYTGPTTVTAGTLQLGTDNTLPASSPVVLAGGTLAMNGFANAASNLTVTGTAKIDLGSSGSLSFADSSGTTWTGTLALTGTLGATTLRFGQNANALTPEQLSRISCNGKRVSLDATGYLVEGSAYSFYWDNNGTETGFGTAGGTWAAPTISQWSFSEDGTGTPEASATTFTIVPVNFGTASAGLAAGTVTVSGTVEADSLQFGSASEAITLSGGSIVLADTSAITVNTTTGTVSSVLAGAATALAKDGDGTLILSGANTYAGATTINGGILEINNALALQNSPLDTASSVTGNDTRGIRAAVTSLTLGGLTGDKDMATLFSTVAGGYESLTSIALNVPTDAELSYAGSIANGAAGMSLTKKGAGTQTLTGANSYTGNLLIEAGIVKLGGDDRLASTSGLELVANAPASATLDLNGYDQTLARLVYTATNLPANLTIMGQAGSTLTINATANTEIGPGGYINGVRNVTADLSGLEAFVWNNANYTFRVGPREDGSNNGNIGTSTVLLARENTLTATALMVGDKGLNNHGGTSFLRLGQTNVLNANTINVGASGRSFATLNFRDGLNTPWVKIRAKNGTSAVTSWDVGRLGSYSGTWNATVDFTGGTLDALSTSLRLGIADTGSQTGRAGTQNSFFLMEKGVLEVTTLSLGLLFGSGGVTSGSAFIGNGTFSLNHADGIVKAGSVLLGTKSNTITLGTGSSASANGIFNLQAGTLEAKTIDRGTQTGAGETTQAFNFSGGTVRNAAGNDLSIANVPVNLIGSGTRVFEAAEGSSMAPAASPSREPAPSSSPPPTPTPV